VKVLVSRRPGRLDRVLVREQCAVAGERVTEEAFVGFLLVWVPVQQ